MRGHKLPPSFLVIAIAAVVILAAAQSAVGIQFYLWKEECFSQKVEEVGDIVRVSFVVVRRKSKLHASTAGVDLVVKGPHGEQVHDDRDKKTEHFEFVAQKKGIYKFCFTTKAGYTEMVDFNIAINHEEHLEPAKNEQLAGVQKYIGRLSKWLEAVEFKQRWLIADQHRLEEINRATNFWAIIKVAVESVALIGSSALQVYLLKRLFKRKVGE
uniref:GOLD domain-containing protein n=1 Tax=Kalanchoe fedtschenkoi TaxID=63787 RepID=A0A7N0SVK2_KALFE